MGFNKRYISKDLILNTIKRKESLVKLVKADALIMDTWSKKFFDNYDFNKKEYEENRSELFSDFSVITDVKEVICHKNFQKLKKLSNVLENLIQEPSWFEILLTTEILKIDIGYTNKVLNRETPWPSECVDIIIKHYSKG